MISNSKKKYNFSGHCDLMKEFDLKNINQNILSLKEQKQNSKDKVEKTIIEEASELSNIIQEFSLPLDSAEDLTSVISTSLGLMTSDL